ncbi:MAG: PhoX family phosphatase [Pseudomonadales bacterium]
MARKEDASTFARLVRQRYTRRRFVQASALLGSVAVTGGISARAVPALSRHVFEEVPRGVDETHHVSPGYLADVLIRWGDPMFADSPQFSPRHQTEAAQLRQFGYNNDFIGFLPLAGLPDGTTRGLLCVNHEYPSSRHMFPRGLFDRLSQDRREQSAVELAAQGGSVFEVQRRNGRWRVHASSPFNRRLSALHSPMRLSGPAAGHERLRTSADPTGQRASGTFANCAGGMTPWGTWLSSEENFHDGFIGAVPDDHPEARNHAMYRIGADPYAWGTHFAQFNVALEPRAPNHFGWVVEIDPMDPASVPVKRTALGRFAHEGAEAVVARDGRVVVYMGDDLIFQYVYKFVSRERLNAGNAAARGNILDTGTLYVARFDVSGVVDWLPLEYGTGPLTPANAFHDQADVLLETRRAAKLMGATPMDRPEGIRVCPDTGVVYLMLTNNAWREVADAANPRAPNPSGHILTITEDRGGHSGLRGQWDVLVRCGDPMDVAAQAHWHPATATSGWFGCPDNCVFDSAGRLWVASDGNTGADGLWGVETRGDAKGLAKAFFRAPVGAEVTGPCFTPDDETLFLSVQHPGALPDGDFDTPVTRWPDFDAALPPRPSVLAITRRGGGRIGT